MVIHYSYELGFLVEILSYNLSKNANSKETPGNINIIHTQNTACCAIISF